MLLKGLHLGNEPSPVDLLIRGMHLEAIYPAGAAPVLEEPSFDLHGCIAWPGLINAHDHLEFNCYPPLRSQPYQNYLDWSADLHQSFPDVIRRVEAIPKAARINYGILKNLLNGITTVIDHSEAPASSTLLHIKDNFRYLHSLRRHKGWKTKLLSPSKQGQSFMVHLHEGYGPAVESDLRRLRRWNIHKHLVIGVHGISLDPAEASYLQGLIWCPGSNDFLYGKSAPVDELWGQIPLLMGTDSTLSGPWQLAEHIAAARRHSTLRDGQLLDLLYEGPARLFPQLNQRNTIRAAQIADLVIYRPEEGSYTLSPLDARPRQVAMVLCAGKPALLDTSLACQLPNDWKEYYFQLSIEGQERHISRELGPLLARELSPIADLLPFSISQVD